MAIQLPLALAMTAVLMTVDCIYYARVSPTALLTEKEGTHTEEKSLFLPLLHLQSWTAVQQVL